MSLQTLRAQIVAAVQAELDRHAGAVAQATQRLRADAAREREELRQQFGQQLIELAEAVRMLTTRQNELRHALEEQMVDRHSSRATAAAMVDLETRVGRRIEQVTTTLDELVEGAVAPHVDAVCDAQELLGRRIDVLDHDLRAFDEQAARLVLYVNEAVSSLEDRSGEAASAVGAELGQRLGVIEARVDEVSEASLRQHVETTKAVRERSDRLEDRLGQRLSSAECSLRDEFGSRVAELDAHVGRATKGLDDTMAVLGDRMSSIDQTIAALDQQIQAVRSDLDGSGSDAIDELKEKVSSAAGEAMLVRIELERFHEASGERIDSINTRLVGVESQLADATMDVSTAIQLERLEELERAVMQIATPTATGRGLAPPAGAPAPAPVDRERSADGTS